MINVAVARRIDPLTVPAIAEAVAGAEAQLANRGRVVLRASGTEPLIRVMVEGEERGEVREIAESLAATVRAAAAG